MHLRCAPVLMYSGGVDPPEKPWRMVKWSCLSLVQLIFVCRQSDYREGQLARRDIRGIVSPLPDVIFERIDDPVSMVSVCK